MPNLEVYLLNFLEEDGNQTLPELFFSDNVLTCAQFTAL
jgi:hypothetical protein